MSVHLCGWVLDEQIPENILRFLEFEDGGILIGGRMSQRMLKKSRLLTRPTLARRDVPFPKQGRSE